MMREEIEREREREGGGEREGGEIYNERECKEIG